MGAFFNEVWPGSKVALLYEDDPGVWHEALVTWPGSGSNRPLAIYTPDGDHYVEYCLGAEAGPHRLALCSASGDCPVVPDGGFYRFRSYPAKDALQELFRDGRRLLESDGSRPARRPQYIDETGQTRVFTAEAAGAEAAAAARGRDRCHELVVREKPDAEEAAEAAGVAALGGAAVGEVEVPGDPLRARVAAARGAVAAEEVVDSVWVLCDPTDPGFGSTIASSGVQHRSGKAGLTDKGLYVKHMTPLEVSGLRERFLDALEAGGATPRGSAAAGLGERLFGAAEGRADPGGAVAVGQPASVGAAAGGGEDLRTCWIDVDDSGTRFKPWRSVVLESSQEFFSDSVIAGPPTCLQVCRKMLQSGGDPKRWFAEWTKELSLSRKDRAWHEVSNLIDILYQGGCYDQLNMGALASMELVSRRLQQYTEAYAHGADCPNWASAKHFSGSSSSLDLVPPEMRSFASRLSKEEAELEHLRARARAPGAGASPGPGAAAAAAAAGGLPNADGGRGDGLDGGKGDGKKGGRGRGARPQQ